MNTQTGTRCAVMLLIWPVLLLSGCASHHHVHVYPQPVIVHHQPVIVIHHPLVVVHHY